MSFLCRQVTGKHVERYVFAGARYYSSENPNFEAFVNGEWKYKNQRTMKIDFENPNNDYHELIKDQVGMKLDETLQGVSSSSDWTERLAQEIKK